MWKMSTWKKSTVACLFNTIVLKGITYGSEMWSLTKAEENTLAMKEGWSERCLEYLSEIILTIKLSTGLNTGRRRVSSCVPLEKKLHSFGRTGDGAHSWRWRVTTGDRRFRTKLLGLVMFSVLLHFSNINNSLSNA